MDYEFWLQHAVAFKQACLFCFHRSKDRWTDANRKLCQPAPNLLSSMIHFCASSVLPCPCCTWIWPSGTNGGSQTLGTGPATSRCMPDLKVHLQRYETIFRALSLYTYIPTFSTHINSHTDCILTKLYEAVWTLICNKMSIAFYNTHNKNLHGHCPHVCKYINTLGDTFSHSQFSFNQQTSLKLKFHVYVSKEDIMKWKLQSVHI